MHFNPLTTHNPGIMVTTMEAPNNSDSKQQLGPIQKAWVDSMRAHPERQMSRRLGVIYPDGSYKACCLGELLVVANGGNPLNVCHREPEFRDSAEISDGEYSQSFLNESWERFGLFDRRGEIPRRAHFRQGRSAVVEYSTLSEANDNGISWPAIADAVEADPARFFTHPV